MATQQSSHVFRADKFIVPNEARDEFVNSLRRALLHFDVKDEIERSKREFEAEAVAYVVGRYFGLDMSGSTFYLAAWAGDDAEVITDRLGRISHTAQELIETIGQKD